VIPDPIGPKTVDGLQVEGKVLDLAWEHRADGKDSTHAKRRAEIPYPQHLMTHWIKTACAGDQLQEPV
jgi:hypothetical protein